MSTTKLNVSRRIRATPYKSCVESHGVSGYSVVNHTVLPKGFRKTVEEDYWHLKKYVQIWDVGCQPFLNDFRYVEGERVRGWDNVALGGFEGEVGSGIGNIKYPFDAGKEAEI